MGQTQNKQWSTKGGLDKKAWWSTYNHFTMVMSGNSPISKGILKYWG